MSSLTISIPESPSSLSDPGSPDTFFADGYSVTTRPDDGACSPGPDTGQFAVGTAGDQRAPKRRHVDEVPPNVDLVWEALQLVKQMNGIAKLLLINSIRDTM